MLFNSPVFIFLFLPLVFTLTLALAKHSRRLAIWFLMLASLVFHAYWDPRHLPILIFSVIGNFLMGLVILRAQMRSQKIAKVVLAAAIAGNLVTLAYYKYFDFLLLNANELFGLHLPLRNIVLPIGISFFTFTQVAYLVDTYRGKVAETKIGTYSLFVTFFPHLIAGPILHHSEMMPQFRDKTTLRWNSENFSVGISLFIVGLFKKVVIADGIAKWVVLAFGSQVANNSSLDVWVGVFAYTMQIYFDFSGYSDMALGVSRLFGIDLPINFNSPYKSLSIVDFWRRWHMTLSRYLRDYLYIPLGGNKCGRARRYANLMITMLLGGLWHGAGWTFIVWGGLHGAYLVINHFWSWVVGSPQYEPLKNSGVYRFGAWALTMSAVVLAWIFFRAPDVTHAFAIVRKMASFGDTRSLAKGVELPDASLGCVFLVALFLLVTCFPNSQQFVSRAFPKGGAVQVHPMAFRFGIGTALLLAVLWAFSLFAVLKLTPSEFLYFNF